MTIENIYQLYSKYFLVDTDTRIIRKNTIFFGLKGKNFNGNKFAKKALYKAASYAIVDEEEYQTDDRIILVKNALETLQKLATYHRQKLGIPIISLTGSNGKTTTKELINSVLSTKFNTTATKGNLNNHIGVPLTLLDMTPNTEIGIIEMGANHLNEIDFLCQIAKPDYGYITNFGKAHLEGFGGEEGVIKGKSELFKFIKSKNGIIFINEKDPIQVEKSIGINSIKFHPSLNFIDATPFVSLQFEETKIQSQLIGAYNYTNIAAAINIGNYFKVDNTNIKTAIENYAPNNNRSQIIDKGSSKIILDAYNANPSSMDAAIKSFHQSQSKNKIIVLGDMFELGMSSEREHQIITNLIEDMNFNFVFLIGADFYKVKTGKASKFESFSEFIKNVNFNDFNNSTILIKGSRGMALERLLDFL
jgi:UDP-N-acetylmuramoyl-tripeptide--D-alanyl-D-alanine ligase